MKIGILGCGYIGKAIASKWKLDGHIVSVTTRKIEKIEYLKTFANHVYLLNPENSLSWDDFIQNQEILLVCVAPDLNSDYRGTYLNTALAIANSLLRMTHPPKQILYIGSTSVYGEYAGEWVDEAMPLYPLNENGKILAQTEEIFSECESPNLKICILRLGEIYGPEREIESRLIRMSPCHFAGTGESYTNLIHRDDILKALNFALQNSLNGIYNLCNDFHLKRRHFYDILCKNKNLPLVQWNASQNSPHGGNRRVSNKKIKGMGFSFDHPLFDYSK